MNKKKIFALLGALVVLLAVLFFVISLPDKSDNTNVTKSSGETALEEKDIYSVSYESIVSITLFDGTDGYEFAKEGAGWICKSETTDEFNMSYLTSLATRLASLKYIDIVSDAKDKLSDFGIDSQNPLLSFECDLGVVSLYPGDMTSSYDGYYLFTSLSDDVYIITSEQYTSVFAPVSEYRKNISDKISYDKITSIEFKNEICSFSLSLGKADMKQGIANAWNMISPIQVQARDSEIEAKLINPISSIPEKMYVSDKGDYENYGLSQKDSYIVLTDSDGNSKTVYFSPDTGGKSYMVSDGSKYIYEMGEDSYSRIRLIDIVSRYIYTTRQNLISTVTVEGSGKKYTLDFSDSPNISVNGKKVTDSQKCNEIFYAVCALLADDINTEPSGDTSLKMTYNLKDGKTVNVAFSDKDARYMNASIDGKPLYTILKSKIDSSMETLEKYAK